MKKVLYFTVFATPFLAMAQNVTSIESAIAKVGNILNMLVPIFIGLAVVVFLWGVLGYVVSKDEEKKRSQEE